MDPNEQYLTALDSHLERHLQPELRKERVQEIRIHLAMDQEDRQEQGLDVNAAAREARRALGSPEVLARQMVRQARGYDSAPAWWLTLACGVALSLATVAMYWVNPMDPYLPSWIVIGLHWIQFIVLIYFGFLVVRTQRWLVWPMAGWLVLAALGMGTLNLTKLNPLTPQSTSARAKMVERDRRLITEQRFVNDWQLGRAPTDQAPVTDSHFAMKNYLPIIPISYTRPMASYSLKRVGASEAARLWKANGEGFKASVQVQLESMQLVHAVREHPNQPWRGFLPIIVRQSIIATAYRVAIFAVVNGLLLLLTWVKLRRKTRLDPLLA